MTTEAQQPVFGIEKVYISDCSLENPNAPESFMLREEPALNMDIEPTHRKVDKDHYEISVKVNVTAKTKSDDKTLFICEVVQSGVFLIQHVPADDMEIILNVAGPNILFPYLRQAISNLIGNAGFPPINLAPFNFDLLYQQSKENGQDQQSQILQ